MSIRPICCSCRKPKKRLPWYIPGVGWLCESCFEKAMRRDIEAAAKAGVTIAQSEFKYWSQRMGHGLKPKILGDPDCPHCKRCAAYKDCLFNFMHSQGDCASHRENCGLPHVGSVQLKLTSYDHRIKPMIGETKHDN